MKKNVFLQSINSKQQCISAETIILPFLFCRCLLTMVFEKLDGTSKMEDNLYLYHAYMFCHVLHNMVTQKYNFQLQSKQQIG